MIKLKNNIHAYLNKKNGHLIPKITGLLKFASRFLNVRAGTFNGKTHKSVRTTTPRDTILL